jgi:hypothetical protein
MKSQQIKFMIFSILMTVFLVAALTTEDVILQKLFASFGVILGGFMCYSLSDKKSHQEYNNNV